MAERLEDATSDRLEVAQLVAEIRERVRREIAGAVDKPPLFRAKSVDSDGMASRKAGELVHSEDLYFLNTHYTYGQLDLNSIQTHRKNLIGRLIVKFKRKILTIVWDNLLRSYFEAEKDFQTHLVRYLNDVSKYVDARDAGNFWELIHKIDFDVGRALERIDRIADQQSATIENSLRTSLNQVYQRLDQMRRDLDRSNQDIAEQAGQLKTVAGVTAGLEAILASTKAPLPPNEVGSQQVAFDPSYVLFENRFRGSEEEIASRLSIYPSIFAEAEPIKSGGVVLDIGAGRGELLELFQRAKLNAYGVDSDLAMVALATKRNQKVVAGDGIAHLRSLGEGELGGVVAIQVVEHLPFAILRELIDLCALKVKTGGRVVFETVNPQSLLALSSNYYRDPSHQAPLHPDTLAYLLTLAGFKVLETRYLSPVAEQAQLSYIDAVHGITPLWADLIERINNNLKQLNQLLYGYQDYCVIAEAR